jgi:hypothetical protein
MYNIVIYTEAVDDLLHLFASDLWILEVTGPQLASVINEQYASII